MEKLILLKHGSGFKQFHQEMSERKNNYSRDSSLQPNIKILSSTDLMTFQTHMTIFLL